MLSRNSKKFTGNYVIDQDILAEEGIRDFTQYAVDPSRLNFTLKFTEGTLLPDFFLPQNKLDTFDEVVNIEEAKTGIYEVCFALFSLIFRMKNQWA